MDEWVYADRACMAFVSTKPIDPIKDIEPLSIEKTNQMIKAYDEAERAYKKFLEALRAYSDCKRRYS